MFDSMSGAYLRPIENRRSNIKHGRRRGQESNLPRHLRGDDGFEDREGHQAPFTLPVADCGLRKDRQSLALNARRRNDYLIFLIALTMASKSGQSPVSSLEWRSLPLARISKAPPLEGISVSDLIRSPSSRILVAKLTAFGV